MTNGSRGSAYAERIAAVMEEEGVRAEVSVRHVEAYMRVGHPTLDGLSALTFREEVRLAVLCVEAVALVKSEALARSYGL
jgi:hypothetical protein